MSYDPQFQHPDGTMKSSAERADYRRSQDRARQLAQASAAHAKRQNAKPTSGHEARIAELKDQLARAFDRGERQQIKRRLVQHQEAHERFLNEQIVAKWEADFDKPALAKLAAESIDRIKRSGKVLYPSATQVQLNALIALQEVRHEFPDAGAFGREFFTMLADIEDQEAAAADANALEASEAAAKAELDSAKANLARAEAQQRANQARSALEGE